MFKTHIPAEEPEVLNELSVPGGDDGVLGLSVLTVHALAEGLKVLKEFIERSDDVLNVSPL